MSTINSSMPVNVKEFSLPQAQDDKCNGWEIPLSIIGGIALTILACVAKSLLFLTPIGMVVVSLGLAVGGICLIVNGVYKAFLCLCEQSNHTPSLQSSGKQVSLPTAGPERGGWGSGNSKDSSNLISGFCGYLVGCLSTLLCCSGGNQNSGGHSGYSTSSRSGYGAPPPRAPNPYYSNPPGPPGGKRSGYGQPLY